MNWNALLPEIVLSLGILLLFFLELFLEKKYFKFLSLLGALTTLAAFFSLFFVEYPAYTFFDTFYVSQLELFGKGMLYILSGLSIVALYDYFLKKDSVYGEVPYLILISTLGLSLFLSSNSFITLFVSLELSSITIYILAAMLRKDYNSKEGAFKYLLMGSVGTALFGMGSSFYYGATGTFFLNPYADSNTIFSLFILFFLSALAVKISAVPFHFWTPDAYEGAPTPVVGYLATAPKFVIYFLLVKLSMLFSHVQPWLILVALLSLLSMFYANFTAYAQRSVKRLLAYSSIAHGGYFLLGISLSDKLLHTGLLFYVSVYTFATLGSFVVLSSLEKSQGFTHHILDYRGLGRENLVLGVLLSFFLLAFIGIPPMALFVGKLNLFLGLVHAKLVLLAFAFVVASIISAGYYLKLISYIFLEEGESKYKKVSFSAGESLTLLVCFVLVILFGLFPHLLSNFIRL
ncbi:NADH-quinone oxidoreductase subunit N [Thermocrinis sp.]|uniref:NADH-quinone oxidoreductase subunit N n=1 Tax=Thermocrinis sp. TaxID=2024383 RepID=UPI002FDDA20C